MRRNLTISFDEAFIDLMDRERGKLSRGKWLEIKADDETAPTPKATRSPKVNKHLPTCTCAVCKP